MKIWKMAHSHLEKNKYDDALDNNIVCLGKDTQKGQYPNFINAEIGDLFYLVSAQNPREIRLIGMFIDKNIFDANAYRDSYVGRRYVVLLEATKKDITISGSAGWKPSGQTTFYEISKDDYIDFEDSILKYNFKTTLQQLIELRSTKMLSISIREKIELLKDRMQIILQGPPGTGKTRLAKQMAIEMINNSLPYKENNDIKTSFKKVEDSGQAKLIQFHPSYSYEDFVRGIVAKSNGDKIEYKTENKILADMAQKALDNKDKKYILIIDEINRANLSSVLGELIYALEYRDEPVESMYELEENSKKTREIILPSNLYIIGTMNTADRSIGHIDYAIRRRFAFESVLPDKEVVNENSKFEEVQKLFKDDNNKKADTLSPEFNPDDVMLGHSYFIAKNYEELNNKLKYQVIPLLNEYVKDGVLQDSAKVKIEEL